MTEVGYSGTSLIKKLGITPEMKVLVIYQPEYFFDLPGMKISDQYISKTTTPDLVHLFAKNVAAFRKEIKVVLKFSKKNPTVIMGILV